MRRSGQPSRPRARICCLLSSPKMLAIPAGNHALHRRVNVLGRRYFTGRFSGVHDWPVLGVHRGRIRQVFRYLRDLNLHRNPAKRLIHDQPWRLSLNDLPDHPSIQRVTIDVTKDPDDEEKTASPYLLKVDRPRLSRPPAPPDSLSDWLERGWDDPLAELKVRPSRNENDAQGDTVVVVFEASPHRVAMLA